MSGAGLRRQVMEGATRVRVAVPAEAAPRSVPLKDQAYELIRHHIITCRFAPGERLNEAAVAEALKLSRMPVRHALARLRLEGLVTIRPRKGIEVRPIDPVELLQINEARLLLECHVTRLAAPRFAAADSSAMKAILRETQAALARHDTEAMMLLDRRFHETIAQASGQAVMAEMLRTLNDRAIRFWFISLERAGQQEEVLRDHRDIHRALARGEAVAAEDAMRAHIEAFRANVMLLMRSGMGGR